MSTPSVKSPDPAPAPKPIHYGSLEEKAKEISARGTAGDDEEKANSEKGEHMPLENLGSAREAFLLAEIERKRRIKSTVVPTDDAEVRLQLRSFKLPTTLFGEGPADRRERLRRHLAELIDADEGGGELIKKQKPTDGTSYTTTKQLTPQEQAALSKEDAKYRELTWYHEGPPELKTARLWIAEYSLPRAARRLQQAREEREGYTESKRQARAQELHKNTRSLTNSYSQIGDTRPLSHCAFSPNGLLLATSSWSGLCKLWEVPSCEEVRTLRGHEINVGCISFHPHATISLSASAYGNMASCDHNGQVKLWSLDCDTPVASIQGHNCRVSRLAYHPSGRFLGTACFDHSWRLWDLTTQKELLYQEGHSKSVYELAFHGDGSLCASVGLDCFGRVWDLRSGRCIMLMEGHQKSVYAVDFSPNGYELITGSEDNSVKVWDLRVRTCLYTIPAHTNLITSVKFEPTRGDLIVSSSFDGTAKVWNHPTWTPLSTLKGHEGKVMSMDINPNVSALASNIARNNATSSMTTAIVTASFDRTFKLWTPE